MYSGVIIQTKKKNNFRKTPLNMPIQNSNTKNKNLTKLPSSGIWHYRYKWTDITAHNQGAWLSLTDIHCIYWIFNEPLTNSCIKLSPTLQNPLLIYSHTSETEKKLITFNSWCLFNNSWEVAVSCSSCHIYHSKIRIK